MTNLFNRHKIFWSDKKLIAEVVIGIVLLFLSMYATYWANIYVARRASSSVTDILLDNIPVVDVDFLYSTGAAIFIIIVVIVAFQDPRRISFILKSTALFFLFRSAFMMLTHIGPPQNMLVSNSGDFFHKLSSGDDLFFSAHTGYPFLIALIFWNHKRLKDLFFALSIIGAVIVILGHYHYSIDVFSAFFITFGIFQIAKNFFKEDYKMLAVT
ncbi:MAG: sphingomyelin synthase family protein [Candidatus Wolfebacteria bacterium]|nr:sphingomyelin synthase family protein [Candidatus Wolfebacteria bacterium]